MVVTSVEPEKRKVRMTSDGISSEDWAKVRELAVALANASDDEDEPHRERVRAYPRELVSKYGQLPSIVATQADYADDPGESERLLLRAFDSRSAGTTNQIFSKSPYRSRSSTRANSRE